MATPSLSAAMARKEFSDLVSRVAYGKERQILTRRGRPVAALIPLEDLELLERLEERVDLALALEALAEADATGSRPWEVVKNELGI